MTANHMQFVIQPTSWNTPQTVVSVQCSCNILFWSEM